MAPVPQPQTASASHWFKASACHISQSLGTPNRYGNPPLKHQQVRSSFLLKQRHTDSSLSLLYQRLKPGKEEKEKYLFFMQCTCWLQKTSACEKKKAWKSEKKIDGIIEWEEIGDLENGNSEIRRSTCASE
jgi:hypothetical protein